MLMTAQIPNSHNSLMSANLESSHNIKKENGSSTASDSSPALSNQDDVARAVERILSDTPQNTSLKRVSELSNEQQQIVNTKETKEVKFRVSPENVAKNKAMQQVHKEPIGPSSYIKGFRLNNNCRDCGKRGAGGNKDTGDGCFYCDACWEARMAKAIASAGPLADLTTATEASRPAGSDATSLSPPVRPSINSSNAAPSAASSNNNDMPPPAEESRSHRSGTLPPSLSELWQTTQARTSSVMNQQHPTHSASDYDVDDDDEVTYVKNGSGVSKVKHTHKNVVSAAGSHHQGDSEGDEDIIPMNHSTSSTYQRQQLLSRAEGAAALLLASSSTALHHRRNSVVGKEHKASQTDSTVVVLTSAAHDALLKELGHYQRQLAVLQAHVASLKQSATNSNATKPTTVTAGHRSSLGMGSATTSPTQQHLPHVSMYNLSSSGLVGGHLNLTIDDEYGEVSTAGSIPPLQPFKPHATVESIEKNRQTQMVSSSKSAPSSYVKGQRLNNNCRECGRRGASGHKDTGDECFYCDVCWLVRVQRPDESSGFGGSSYPFFPNNHHNNNQSRSNNSRGSQGGLGSFGFSTNGQIFQSTPPNNTVHNMPERQNGDSGGSGRLRQSNSNTNTSGGGNSPSHFANQNQQQQLRRPPPLQANNVNYNKSSSFGQSPNANVALNNQQSYNSGSGTYQQSQPPAAQLHQHHSHGNSCNSSFAQHYHNNANNFNPHGNSQYNNNNSTSSANNNTNNFSTQHAQNGGQSGPMSPATHSMHNPYGHGILYRAQTPTLSASNTAPNTLAASSSQAKLVSTPNTPGRHVEGNLSVPPPPPESARKNSLISNGQNSSLAEKPTLPKKRTFVKVVTSEGDEDARPSEGLCVACSTEGVSVHLDEGNQQLYCDLCWSLGDPNAREVQKQQQLRRKKMLPKSNLSVATDDSSVATASVREGATSTKSHQSKKSGAKTTTVAKPFDASVMEALRHRNASVEARLGSKRNSDNENESSMRNKTGSHGGSDAGGPDDDLSAATAAAAERRRKRLDDEERSSSVFDRSSHNSRRTPLTLAHHQPQNGSTSVLRGTQSPQHPAKAPSFRSMTTTTIEDPEFEIEQSSATASTTATNRAARLAKGLGSSKRRTGAAEIPLPSGPPSMVKGERINNNCVRCNVKSTAGFRDTGDDLFYCDECWEDRLESDGHGTTTLLTADEVHLGDIEATTDKKNSQKSHNSIGSSSIAKSGPKVADGSSAASSASPNALNATNNTVFGINGSPHLLNGEQTTSTTKQTQSNSDLKTQSVVRPRTFVKGDRRNLNCVHCKAKCTPGNLDAGNKQFYCDSCWSI